MSYLQRRVADSLLLLSSPPCFCIGAIPWEAAAVLRSISGQCTLSILREGCAASPRRRGALEAAAQCYICDLTGMLSHTASICPVLLTSFPLGRPLRDDAHPFRRARMPFRRARMTRRWLPNILVARYHQCRPRSAALRRGGQSLDGHQRRLPHNTIHGYRNRSACRRTSLTHVIVTAVSRVRLSANRRAPVNLALQRNALAGRS